MANCTAEPFIKLGEGMGAASARRPQEEEMRAEGAGGKRRERKGRGVCVMGQSHSMN